MKGKKDMTLKEALETMLSTAESKLARAKEKNSDWDINHYENDITFIKSELKIVTQSK